MHLAKEFAGWVFFAFTALCLGSIAHVGLLGGV